MHQSDFMKGKHDISKIKNMKKLQVSQLTQQQYEAIQRNVILMHTHIYSEYTMHNAHSSPSKYPSRCQSLGHQSLSPLQSRELRQTQLTRAKAKQIVLTWQSNLSQSARLNFLTEWCSCLNLGPKMANGTGDALQKLHPRPRSTCNLQAPGKTIIRHRSHESLAAHCITMPKPVITFDYLVHFARPGSVAPHSICHSLQRWSLWPGLTVDP